MCPMFLLSLSRCFMGRGFRNPLTPSIKAGLTSRASWTAGTDFRSDRGLETPSQAVVPHLVPTGKNVLELNKHESSTYFVLDMKDPQLGQSTFLPCLLAGVVCRYLNLVNYCKTRFPVEEEAPEGRGRVFSSSRRR